MKCVEISGLCQIPGPPPSLLLALSLSYAFPMSLLCFVTGVEKEKKEGKREVKALRTSCRAKWTPSRTRSRQGDEENEMVGEFVQPVKKCRVSQWAAFAAGGLEARR